MDDVVVEVIYRKKKNSTTIRSKYIRPNIILARDTALSFRYDDEIDLIGYKLYSLSEIESIVL